MVRIPPAQPSFLKLFIFTVRIMSEKNNDQYSVSKDDAQTTTKLLSNIYTKNTDDNIKIGVLLKSIETGGFALLIFIFALLLVIPTPPPVATIAGVIIMFFSFQMAIGLNEVWLPKFMTQKSIQRKTLALIVEKSSVHLYKLERFTRRRLTFMNSVVAERIIGIIIFILAAITLTPIIFANSVPGMAIILISFGLLNKDGLIVIIGFAIGIFSMFVVWSMVVFGKAIVLKLIEKLF